MEFFIILKPSCRCLYVRHNILHSQKTVAIVVSCLWLVPVIFAISGYADKYVDFQNIQQESYFANVGTNFLLVGGELNLK